jgi:uncharacterized phage infection (PIP) family protein YhgE
MYLVLALYTVVLLVVTYPFILTPEPDATALNTNLTTIIITVSLGLFAVFALLSGWYFNKIDDIKKEGEEGLKSLRQQIEDEAQNILGQLHEANELSKKETRELHDETAELKQYFDEAQKKIDETLSSLDAQININNDKVELVKDMVGRVNEVANNLTSIAGVTSSLFFLNRDYITTIKLTKYLKEGVIKSMLELIGYCKLKEAGVGEIINNEITSAAKEFKKRVEELEFEIQGYVTMYYDALPSDLDNVDEIIAAFKIFPGQAKYPPWVGHFGYHEKDEDDYFSFSLDEVFKGGKAQPKEQDESSNKRNGEEE